MPDFEWGERDYVALVDMLASVKRHEGMLRITPPSPTDGATAHVDLTGRLEAAIAERDLSDYFDQVTEIVPSLYYAGMSLVELLRLLTRQSDVIFAALEEDYGNDAPRLAAAGRVYAKLRAALSVRVGEVYAELRTQEVEEANRKVIRELSTPVIQVWEGVLVMPLVGVVDSTRANQMTEQLLTRITELSTRIVIIDVTGVPTVDTEVANHFIRATRAARLLGATSIMVGITPKVAQTLVRLDIDLGRLETYSDLRSGLQRALTLLGHRLVSGEAEA